MKCELDHIVINVVDVEVMIDFYTRVLDLPSERLEEYRQEKVPFPSVRITGDTIIDLFPEKMWRKQEQPDGCQPNLNHLCLAMEKDPWQGLQKRLESAGVEITEGPVQRWGAHGRGISIYFHDPEDNVIEARYYEGDENGSDCLLDS